MLRLANSKEIEFYENFLYPFQDKIFELIQSEMFYLTGVTCLSRFYYEHRYSDDLDFFFDGFNYPEEKFEIDFRKIVERISNNYEIKILDSSLYFKRMIVYKDEQPLKIEFIFEYFKTIGSRKIEKNIKFDSKENIVNM
ncbi:nucleotidyl transferase AbiEii/AbiGii toxin family protein [bacterium]|nr:nucleotidyl transferase AbiEii/AbiGii toxin family protein [bacterium]